MRDQEKTRAQLINELIELGHRTAELEKLEPDHKRMEETLKASELRFRRLFETAQDGILILNADTGMIEVVNPFLIDMLGYSHKELLGKKLWEIGFFKDIGASQSAFKELQEKEYVRYEDLPLETKKGRCMEVEFVSNVYKVDGEKVIQCNVRDITGRKVSKALREEKERTQQYLDIAEAIIVVIASDQTVTLINKKGTEVLGYTTKEIIGKNWYDTFIPERLRERIKSVAAELLAGKIGPVKYFESPVLTKGGEERIIAWCNTIVRDGAGQILASLSSGEDVTERKQAEEALKESERRYRSLFDGMPIGLYRTTTTGKIIDANPALIEMLGYLDWESLSKVKVADTYIDPEERKSWQTLMSQEGIVRNFQKQLRQRDGAAIWVEENARAICDAEGRVLFYEGSFQEIMERKRAEEEMTALQEQLRQSQKMEAIGQLAGGIAHDFNNLLTIIKGYSQLSLIDLKESDPLRENIEEVKRATDRASDLIRQLLAFSRRQLMEMKVLDLNILLQNVDKMLHRVIGEDIELLAVLAHDLGSVKVDPGQIEQVVLNLAVNARDAMPSGGKLTIETANVELDEAYARRHIAVTPGRYVMLAVSDTGMGMTPEIRDRVFEPFFTTKEKGKGTGLGLSTVYGIVKQSGGNIWVYSESGKGTTFKIYFPKVDEPLEEIKEKAVKEELPRGSETVLVVEDEEEVRKVAARILRGQGYKVLEASNGADTLMICKEQKEPIHLILTDIVMPQMSGCELAKCISSIHPEIKVLYMSGYTDNAITHNGILEEGIKYIKKPFEIEGLARKVREVLDK